MRRFPRSGNGGRSYKASWRMSGRRSSEGLKVRSQLPPPAALPPSLALCRPLQALCLWPLGFPIFLVHPLITASLQQPHPTSQTDDASRETQEPESFSAWSERLGREHAQKQRRQQLEAEGSRRPPRAEGSSHSWRQQEEEQRLFRERSRVKEKELCESRARRAQEAQGDRGPAPPRAGPRAEHPRGAGRGSLWRFGDVPWPCPGGGDPEAMAAALVARGPPLEEQGALKRYLRVQQVRWHPDRFLQRFRNQIETWELGRVMGAVTALSQALNRHAEALK